MVRKIAAFLIAVLPLLSLAAAADMTVDDIISKNIEARGGLDKIKAVKTVKMTAKVLSHGMEMPGTLALKRPSNVRMEFTVQGQNIVQAYDGTTAWMIMPLMGNKDPQKMTDEDAREIIEQADFDGPLVDYKAKGNTVELMGKEDVEGTPAYKLKVALKNGDVRYIYIDADNYLELKTSSVVKREGTEYQIDSFSGDYKQVNGLTVPFSVENKMKDQTMSQITIDKVEFDQPLDDSLFHMPAATESAPAK